MKAYLISFLLFFGAIENILAIHVGEGHAPTDKVSDHGPLEDFATDQFISHWEQNHALFRKLVAKLDKDFRKFQGHPRFLRSLYFRTEMYLLEEYQQYALLEDVMQQGKFDCVSGSLLLASLLEKYEVPYKIMETSHHVFVVVEQDGEK